jgi:serine/threonine protein kinase/tetratricopeptide (TPR) repeat protein
MSAKLADVVESGKAAPPPPRLGDDLYGYTLTAELGQGSFGRVYQAKQQKLSDRYVVVKVTHRPTREPQKLARLQHPHVVPVYDVFEAGGVQVIIMPFVGTRTLAHLLGDFRSEHSSRRGRRSGLTLKSGSTTTQWSNPFGRPAGAFAGPPAAPTGEPVPLVRDVPAALKALAGLAAGLAHAHENDILHLDIKPANVLFTDAKKLMLLDFGLALDRRSRERDEVGGTIQYMAPEQLDDIRSAGKKGRVDARTDLYSLGLMAYELLTGRLPFPFDRMLSSFDDLMAERAKRLTPASDVNPAVPPAVDSILAKLLATDPAERYQSAADLCEDLRRQLAHEPLKFAPNTSLTERAAKWRRRNPGGLWKLVTAAALLAVTGVGVAHERKAAALDREAVARATADAAVLFKESRTGLGTLRLDLILADDPRATARGHASGVELLAKYGLPDDANWRKRDQFARLPAAQQTEVAHDLGEVLLLRAHATWRAGKPLADAARLDAAAQALKFNRLAETCFADAVPPFLRAQRAELLAAAGEPGEGGEVGTPQTPREWFLAGVGEFAAAKYTAAAGFLKQAAEKETNHAAAQMLLAVCTHHQGQYGGAAERYDFARVLIPTDPRPFFYRGVALATGGKRKQAVEEFTAAIDLDPEYREAYRNRAIAHYRQGDLAAAERDLTRGLEIDGPPFQFHEMRALVRAARKDAAGAAADMKAIADTKPEREMDYLVRVWARNGQNPVASLADLREAEKRNPRSAQVLMGQIKILADVQKKLPEALAVATRLKAAFPDFAHAFAARAVILARMGQGAEAKAEVEKARTLSDEASVTYRVACVFALSGDAGDRAEAVPLLRKAYLDGYRFLDEIEKDPDLAAIRGTPAFDTFLKAAREVGR